jgi:signal transduction histidine kinase
MNAAAPTRRSADGSAISGDNVFAALPFAAWLAGDAGADRLRGNAHAVATAGATVASCADLEALFEFEDGADGWLRRQLMALFADGAERRFEGRLRKAPGRRFDFRACAVGDPARPAAVLLLASPVAATFMPGDWWQRVGHDLRGPVTPVRMALQLLKSGRVDPEHVAQTAALADRQLDPLLAVIDDVSGLLAMMADASTLQRIPVDLSALLECSAPDGPVVVVGDPVYLRQLFAYAAGRAADNAPGATIRVVLAADAGRATVRIGGAGPALADDAGLACVAGATAVPAGPDLKSLLMREVARRHAAILDLAAAPGEIRISLPLAPPATG